MVGAEAGRTLDDVALHPVAVLPVEVAQHHPAARGAARVLQAGQRARPAVEGRRRRHRLRLAAVGRGPA